MTGQSATFGHGSPTANIAIVPTTPTVSVSDVGARVSFGATTAATVTVMYSVNADLSGSTTTTGVAVDSTTDFTGKIDITGLAANTPYYYTPVIGGVAQYTSSYPTFKTLPASGVASAFTFAFGSCTRHGGSIAQDTIFDVVPSSTRFLLHIGDTIYADTDGSPSSVLSQFRLKHRDALAAVDMTSVGWKALRERTPVFTMWDDHEITNDFSAGKGNALYAPARQAFGEYHGRANPDPITSGELYYTIQCGEVGFFMLDGRSFRSANTATDDSSKTILGATQKAALKSWLLSNTSTLKFVVTTTLAAGYATTGQDSWGGVDDSTQAPNGTNGFRTERNEIWDYIDANRISGVAFISGDQHWGGSFKTIYAGRPRYEFLASGFNSSFLAPVSRAADPVNGPVFWKVGSKFNFGLVSVDTTVTPATVSFQSYDPTGSLGSSYLTTLNANQLDAGLPVSVALSGQTMTAGHGALSPTGTVDVALSGQSMSATMGTVKPGLMHALTGQDAQYTQGSVTPVSHEGVTVALVGQATAFAHGQTRPSAVVVLQGRAASFAQGSPTAQTGHNVTLALGGQAAGFAHGNLSSAAFAAMAGQSIHGQTGTFDKASRVGMSGAQAAFIAGTLTPRAGIMITEPGRTALFPAEQRTARFAV
jgi:alkaline phosphatase D